MTFELESPTRAKLAHVNCRSEMSGKEAIPAVDLKIVFDAPNDYLSMLDGWLLSALYTKDAKGPAEGAQGTIDGVEPVSDRPNLRMPMLASPIRWAQEFSGYELTIDFGLGGPSNIVISDCLLNNIAIVPKEGGTCEFTLRLQCSSGLTESILGRLALLVQHDITILLAPPSVEGEQR